MNEAVHNAKYTSPAPQETELITLMIKMLEGREIHPSDYYTDTHRALSFVIYGAKQPEKISSHIISTIFFPTRF